MSSHTIEDLTSCILDFQANMVRVTYRKKNTVVEPELVPGHAALLDYIWTNSKVQEEPAPEGGTIKWRKLGFDSEDLTQEFGEVGVLGLDCLVRAGADKRWQQVVADDAFPYSNILSLRILISSQRCASCGIAPC